MATKKPKSTKFTDPIGAIPLNDIAKKAVKASKTTVVKKKS